KALGNYKGHRALYKSMDEFYDSEVTITIQQHHWKPWATPKDHAKKAEARHGNFRVAIHPDFSDQEITIGGTVSIKARTELCTLLKRNLDIFAWQPSDMTGDCYPLLEIDWKAESLCGYPFKFFLNANKGYHQIQMAEQDEEKTAFHTSHGVRNKRENDKIETKPDQIKKKREAEDGNPARANVKQALGRKIVTILFTLTALSALRRSGTENKQAWYKVGVAASFQRSRIHKPHAHNQAFKKEGETIEDFIERFKVETGRMKGAPECMRISEFMHGVNNPELTKRLNEHVPKTVEEMMIATVAFIRGETAAASKKKPRDGRGSNKFTPLTITPKEIFAAESGKFKPSPPMVTPVEKRSSNKFCEFHNDKGHNIDEYVQLRKQIEELVRAGKLSHFIKEIRRDKDQQKTRKKAAPVKDKATTIYMIQPWQRVTRQKVTQSFALVKEITFPPLTANKGTGGPLVIEA
nr:hypothetical protein [Tanacetum cinerariifolium]